MKCALKERRQRVNQSCRRVLVYIQGGCETVVSAQYTHLAIYIYIFYIHLYRYTYYILIKYLNCRLSATSYNVTLRFYYYCWLVGLYMFAVVFVQTAAPMSALVGLYQCSLWCAHHRHHTQIHRHTRLQQSKQSCRLEVDSSRVSVDFVLYRITLPPCRRCAPTTAETSGRRPNTLCVA